MRDDETGLTLAEKIAQGVVTIGPAVRIGRYVEIGPGVTVSESNLDDDVDVRAGAVIQRSEIRDGAIIGSGARVRDAFVGSMSEIRSSPRFPTSVEDYVALGDEVVVYSGVNLAGEISVYPRLKIPNGIVVPHGAELTGPADVLRYL
jgi:NDP-sugar pyrophosphorylase family protein